MEASVCLAKRQQCEQIVAGWVWTLGVLTSMILLMLCWCAPLRCVQFNCLLQTPTVLSHL